MLSHLDAYLVSREQLLIRGFLIDDLPQARPGLLKYYDHEGRTD